MINQTDVDQLGVGLRGQLLIAMPQMNDENFKNSVILMAEHSSEGAMGFMLNQLDDSVSLSDLLGQLEVPIDAEVLFDDRLVRDGGPCSPNHGFIIHPTIAEGTDSRSYEGSETIDEHFSFTVSTDILRDFASGKGPERYLVSIGYAGWGPGQLEAELRENVWINCPATEGLVFDCAPEMMWDASFQQLGITPALLNPVAGRA